MRKALACITASAGFICTGVTLHAQDMTLGEFEYQNSCVACHGTSGKGDGPVTDFLSGATVPDLTAIQENNGGVFPVTEVFKILEGGGEPSAHGTRDMPIWGNRFKARTSGNDDSAFHVSDAESYAKFRILALIEYLASIQGE